MLLSQRLAIYWTTYQGQGKHSAWLSAIRASALSSVSNFKALKNNNESLSLSHVFRHYICRYSQPDPVFSYCYSSLSIKKHFFIHSWISAVRDSGHMRYEHALTFCVSLHTFFNEKNLCNVNYFRACVVLCSRGPCCTNISTYVRSKYTIKVVFRTFYKIFFSSSSYGTQDFNFKLNKAVLFYLGSCVYLIDLCFQITKFWIV